MIYAEVFIKGTNGLFTWHSERPVQVGSRVEVPFRGKPKLGIVLRVFSTAPDFKTQPIARVVNEFFVPETSIALALEMSEFYFTSINKIMGLMIPTKFLEKEFPVKSDSYVRKTPTSQAVKLRGKVQQSFYDQLNFDWVNLKYFEKRPSKATIDSLIAKNLIEISDENLELKTDFEIPDIQLNEEQTLAHESITNSHKPTLLWGVTGSGKTEVYKSLAKAHLESQDQVLILVPEIGLTPQLINHFKSVFGSEVAVWHSNLSEGEKTKAWNDVVLGKTKILVGARSAVLVPLPRLKLIIVDEEHEWTYKNEFNPRFWIHDIAERLAKRHKAKLVFGSATPRVESFYKTQNQTWNLARLTQKFYQSARPSIQLVNLQNEVTRGNYSPISQPLKDHLKAILKAGRQAVIFLNKRGYAGATMCRFCGHTFECDNCSANMKVHGHKQEKLVCHICHALKFFPKKCPGCNQNDFKFKGWGTQQVEMVLRESFPEAKIFRADSDALGGKHDFDKLIERFHNHEADILLGTQMIAKGLDFDKVDLVGLILADVGLTLPDFRSEERVFQILNQVAGRTGRREKAGQVLVQTYEPDHEVFDYLIRDDVAGFIEQQLASRKLMSMPPFTTIIKCTFDDIDKAMAFKKAQNFYNLVKKDLPDEEIFWAPAFFPRIHNKYWFHVFIKTNNSAKIQEYLRSVDTQNVRIDIDPASLL